VGPLGHGLAALSALGALPVALGGLALRPAWRRGIHERLGSVPRGPAGTVWVHAASVGEAAAAVRLVDALRAHGREVAVSTMTVTGRDLMRSARPGVPCGLAPLDHPWCVARAHARVRPAALVLVETELWPARILVATARGVPALVVSGRISDRSFPRYQRASVLLHPLLRRLERVGARTEQDAERFVALGADEARVEVTGDLKLEPPADARALPAELEAALGDAPLLVGGSTHPGEEEALLDVLDRVSVAGRELALVLAPRHPERFDEAERVAQETGRVVHRRSKGSRGPLRPGEVLVLDTLGELAGVYARAAVVFVGGSLVPRGGHNVLEPVFAGRPVFFGPHTENAREAARLLLEAGAATRVADAAELARGTLADLADPAAAAARGEAGSRALAVHRGAAARAAELVESVLEQRP
jgi:3-deoxy-D-manno-octulosonic-acid transferase